MWQGEGPGSPFRQLLRPFVVLLVLLLLFALALVGFQFASFQKQGDAPAAVARQFCDAVVQQEYDQAAGYLQDNASADGFLQSSQARDAADGPVRECRVLGRDVWGSFGADHAAYTVTDVLNDGQHTGTIHLYLYQPQGSYIYDPAGVRGARWVVESIDRQLHLDAP